MADTPTTAEVLQQVNVTLGAMQDAQARAVEATEKLYEHNTDEDAHEGLIKKIKNGEIGTGGGASMTQVANAIKDSTSEINKALVAEIKREGSSIKEGLNTTIESTVSKQIKENSSSQISQAIEVEVKRIFKTQVVGTGDPVFGIARVKTGGGSGLWFHVDSEGEPINLNTNYFDTHPIYGAIERQIIDGQIMVRIPKFYVKHVQSMAEGSMQGCKVTFISPDAKEGFHVHPAFMHNGEEIDQFWIASYKGCNDASNTKIGSLPGQMPAVSTTFTQFQQKCAARNTGGVDGFMLQDVYQYAAIQLLMLAELANPDTQNVLGNGHCNGSGAVTVDNVANPKPWRGIYGLWGNVWECVDGVRADSSRRLEIWGNDGRRNYIATLQNIVAYGSGQTGWAKEMFSNEDPTKGYDLKDVFIPETVDGSQGNGTYASGVWGAVANGVLYVGGSWDRGAACGLFCVYFGLTASSSGTGHGCRLAKV